MSSLFISALFNKYVKKEVVDNPNLLISQVGDEKILLCILER